jgi:ribosomal protein S18 acetylase RimI-like enzyme
MWQPMTLDDLENVYLISQNTWADYGETFDIYKNKFLIAPNGCYVYKEDNINTIKGYIISHPWNIHYPPPQLNTPLVALEENCWFIHDIVILPECRGAGIGDEIIRKILNDNSIVSLVAADDETVKTKEFWTKYGFKSSEHIRCSYGIYMIRTISF